MPELSPDELKQVEALEAKSATSPDGKTPPPAKPTAGLKFLVAQTKVDADLSLINQDLDEAVRQQASLYNHYGTNAAKAEWQYDRSKADLELIEAVLDGQYRQQLADDGKKATETQVKALILQDPKYRAAQEKMHMAKMIAGIGKKQLESFEQHTSMIIQLASTSRKEMEGEMRFKAQESSTVAQDALRKKALAAETARREV